MKVTKLELQQSLNRVNKDLVHALEQLSEARGDYEASQLIRGDLERTNDELVSKVEDLCVQMQALRVQNSFLIAKLNEADHRARKLIRSANIQRNTETSERRAQMEAARAKAMALGTVTKVGG